MCGVLPHPYFHFSLVYKVSRLWQDIEYIHSLARSIGRFHAAVLSLLPGRSALISCQVPASRLICDANILGRLFCGVVIAQ
jgi:hypothetical protein